MAKYSWDLRFNWADLVIAALVGYIVGGAYITLLWYLNP